MTEYHNVHALLHGPCHRSYFFYSTNQGLNSTYWNTSTVCAIMYYKHDDQLFLPPQPMPNSEDGRSQTLKKISLRARTSQKTLYAV